MAESKHTPPSRDWVAVPWHIAEGPAEVRHVDGWLVCEVPADSYAYLFAASALMLEALKDAEPHIQAPHSIVSRVRAAIAKAEGRS